MKLKAPTTSYAGDKREVRYLTHCRNVALILAHADTVQHGKAKVDEYLTITDNKEIDK